MGRGLAAEHREKRQRRIVARALVDRRDAALGDEIEADARSGRLIRALSAKLPSSDVFACASCFGSPTLPAHKGHGRICDCAAAGLNLALNANSGVGRAACQAQKSKDPERQSAPRRPLLPVSLHVIPLPRATPSTATRIVRSGDAPYHAPGVRGDSLGDRSRSAAAPGASLPPGPASPNLGRNATHGDEDHERNL